MARWAHSAERSTPIDDIPPGAPPASPPGAPEKSDSLALGAFIVSLIGLVLVFASLAAIVMGVMARRRLARTGAPGRGLATAAIIIGAVEVVVFVVLLVALYPLLLPA